MTFSVLNYLQLPRDVGAVERWGLRLSALREEDGESVLVSVEGEILSYQFIDYQVLIGEVGPVGWRIVEGAENFSSYTCSDLREHSPFFECFLEDFFEFVDAGHLI